MVSAKTLELQNQVKKLRAEGNSYRKIGEILGISAAYAHILDKPELYNTDERRKKHKEYREKSREYNLEYGKKWRSSHPDYMKNWYQSNKDRYKKYNKSK